MLPQQSKWMASAASGSHLLIPSSSATCILKVLHVCQKSGRKPVLGPMLHHSCSRWGENVIRVPGRSFRLHQTVNVGPSVEWRLDASHATWARRTFSTSSFASSSFIRRFPRRKNSEEIATGEKSVSEAKRLEEFLSPHSGSEARTERLVSEVASDPGLTGTFVINGSQSQRNVNKLRSTTASTLQMTMDMPDVSTSDQSPIATGQDEASANSSNYEFQDMKWMRGKDTRLHKSRVSDSDVMQGEEMASEVYPGDNSHSTEVETVSADLLEMDSGKHPGVHRRSKAEGWRKHPHQENEKSYHKAKENLTIPRGHDLLYGISPCLLALQHAKREVHQLYITSAFKNSQRSEVKDILALVEERGLRVWTTNRRVLDKFSEERPHQGVCMETSRLYFSPVREEEDEGEVPASSVRLVLDQIKDPMNLGALLRSAYFLGVDKVIVSKKNCCSLTPVVSKASSGVMEIIPVYATALIPSYLENEKLKGWSIVGASVGGSSSSEDVIPCHEYNPTGPVLLVVGNEGFGLSSDISEQCSEFISIPAGRQLHAGIDSLNVSVATGILLHSLLGRR
ncbi:rRNA methyltransferase 1, mitochondrial-like [Strongylocentrotus purpuratus]|uniref:rRNA methyltransferase 1, mitochondrial n=1 Tax=Strongylocentrotus purpuratus TaxID=7668 RepID=A0A7M7HLF8_STRPU|nr:rRNA methyltransferase 1, mitochondrial-like [Strongylocentrotus purpuratus]